jgi:hypothetical protein
MDTRIAQEIARKAEWIRENEADIGLLSTGEAIAVALVLDRKDLLPRGYTRILEAVDRLGDDWLRAAIAVQKALY